MWWAKQVFFTTWYVKKTLFSKNKQRTSKEQQWQHKYECILLLFNWYVYSLRGLGDHPNAKSSAKYLTFTWWKWLICTCALAISRIVLISIPDLGWRSWRMNLKYVSRWKCALNTYLRTSVFITLQSRYSYHFYLIGEES